ncbi:UDP-N-acetylglucosamine transferase subunit ALG14 homolog [Condylostylus longicornis]|uniref:UDP-N-acetylglucosamine transferase subunit ALG14 homolog n=1 Tax=Condylostylus longicornis TaxID=2530218 RepID=UPI00244E595F|nr:UDP-N-acetylglucosamine transferase subunit ALG14 homolog [Condylostylus longicornis]
MRNKPARTLIVLGSGGHTAEMVEIVKNLDKTKYTPRVYVVANTDKTSKNKIKNIEEALSDKSFELYEIHRSREVKQNYFSSVFSTLLAILSAFPLIYKIQPDLVLCNGPGTCVPICLVAFLFRKMHIIPKSCKIVFLESYCRVNTISLTGKILLHIVDMFVVQWPQLESGKTQYLGKLM